MLSPDSRTVATELLRPPPGYRLDHTVLTTYTLDLETLLALPFGVLSRSDADWKTLLQNPLLLLETLRSEAHRFHVFVDHGGIAIPGPHRTLYGMLEPCVHPVRAPNGGVFHPKVWLARFAPTDDARPALLRVGILSRNLTDDRSWDVALTSEASPGADPVEASRPLSDLLHLLPDIATQTLSGSTATTLRTLAAEVARTGFPAPEGFLPDPVQFHLLGRRGDERELWRPTSGGWRLLAIAPFLSAGALDRVHGMSGGERILVSRQDALDRLPEDRVARWGEESLRILRDDALDETADAGNDGSQAPTRPSGLHAKLIAVEHRYDVTWFVGSANLTHAALAGRNVEMMAAIRGRKGYPSGKTGRGIEPFLEGGFLDLCTTYHRSPSRNADAPDVVAARQRLEEAEEALLTADLRLRCTARADDYRLVLEGEFAAPPGIECLAWPVSVSTEQALPLAPSGAWTLPETHLTAFIGFRLCVGHPEVEDVHLTRKLPADGFPETRLPAVLRSLIDSPERLLEFLRALLGGLESMADMAPEPRKSAGSSWDAGLGFGGETLLEDLLRAASRDPERLKPIRRLIEDLRKTPEGRELVPDDLLAIWNAVDSVVSGDDS